MIKINSTDHPTNTSIVKVISTLIVVINGCIARNHVLFSVCSKWWNNRSSCFYNCWMTPMQFEFLTTWFLFVWKTKTSKFYELFWLNLSFVAKFMLICYIRINLPLFKQGNISSLLSPQSSTPLHVDEFFTHCLLEHENWFLAHKSYPK